MAPVGHEGLARPGDPGNESRRDRHPSWRRAPASAGCSPPLACRGGSGPGGPMRRTQHSVSRAASMAARPGAMRRGRVPGIAPGRGLHLAAARPGRRRTQPSADGRAGRQGRHGQPESRRAARPFRRAQVALEGASRKPGRPGGAGRASGTAHRSCPPRAARRHGRRPRVAGSRVLRPQVVNRTRPGRPACRPYRHRGTSGPSWAVRVPVRRA